MIAFQASHLERDIILWAVRRYVPTTEAVGE
jgi:hypothetical protein